MHLRERAAQPHDALAAYVKRVAARRRIVLGRGGARLHRGDDDAAADGAHARDMGGAGEQAVDLGLVAGTPVETDVAGRLVVELRRALGQRRLGIDDRRQRVDVDLDRIGRVLGLGQVLGDHDGKRLAHMADPIGGEGVARRNDQGRAVAALERHGTAEDAVARGLQIGAGVDGDDARHAPGLLDVEEADDAMAHIGSPHPGDECLIRGEIVGITAVSLDEARILLARDRLTDAELDELEARGCKVAHSTSAPDRQCPGSYAERGPSGEGPRWDAALQKKRRPGEPCPPGRNCRNLPEGQAAALGPNHKSRRIR